MKNKPMFMRIYKTGQNPELPFLMRWGTWLAKQILPLHYHCSYKENGVRHLLVWRMWMGRVFAEKEEAAIPVK